MVRKKPRHRPRRRTSRAGWWVAGGVVVLAALVWVAMRPAGMREAGIPIATLVGEEAPVLEFPDATGRRHRVPARGRPTVLIFHMGLH